MKELLKTFHLNGNTIGFHPQTQKVRTISYNKINSITGKYYLRLVTLISSEVRTTLTSPKFTQEVKELYEYLYIEKKKDKRIRQDSLLQSARVVTLETRIPTEISEPLRMRLQSFSGT